jgi:uncharacterized membrane protein
MNIEAQDSVAVAPGSNETFIMTVNNVGSKDLSDVSISTSSVPSDWVTIYPSKITIASGTSRDYLVVVSVPINETGSKTMEFVATSSSGTTSTKNIELQISTSPTGLLGGFSKNLLNLGIVIVAVAALVLIAWELWFRKSK